MLLLVLFCGLFGICDTLQGLVVLFLGFRFCCEWFWILAFCGFPWLVLVGLLVDLHLVSFCLAVLVVGVAAGWVLFSCLCNDYLWVTCSLGSVVAVGFDCSCDTDCCVGYMV